MITTVVLAFLFLGCRSQDIVFPADVEETLPGKIPPRLGDNRVPVFVAGRCPINQLLYPGDQKQDWICDCGPGHLYYPAVNACSLAYRQGPCEVNEILVLPKNSVVPECTPNPCKNDGFVQYEGECYELNSLGPCRSEPAGWEEKFSVNQTTFEVQCVPKGTDTLALIVFPPNCPPGSKRSANKCRPEY